MAGYTHQVAEYKRNLPVHKSITQQKAKNAELSEECKINSFLIFENV